MIDFLNQHGPAAVSLAGQMLWQCALLVGALWLLDLTAGRRLRSTLRCSLWLLVVVKLLLPPSLQLPTGAGFWLGRWLAEPVRPPVAASRSDVVEVVEPTLSPADNQQVRASRPAAADLSLSGWLLGGWMAGAALLAAGLVIRHRPVRRLGREAKAVPRELQLQLESAAAELGLRRLPRFRLSEAHHSPALCGLFRPVILLPAELAGSLSPAGLRAVLLHELVHLRRCDLWVNLVQGVVQVLWWWNPLVWLANARIRTLREQAVDEVVVLATREDPVAYPATLVEVARHCAARPILNLSFLGIFESRRALRARVVRLLNSPLPVRADLGVPGWGCWLAAALLALPMGFSRRVAVAATVPTAGAGPASPARPAAPPVPSTTPDAPQGLGAIASDVPNAPAQTGPYRMDPVLARRYGLTPSAAASSGTSPGPQLYRMDPVLAARYGLLPPGQPAAPASGGAAPAASPALGARPAIPDGATILQVTIPAEGGRFRVEGKDVGVAELKAMLTGRAQAHSNLVLSLATDGEVPFARVKEALQAASAAGITRIAMANREQPVAETNVAESGPSTASGQPSSPAATNLLTRQYRVNPNAFIEGLEAVLGRPLRVGSNGASGTNSTQGLQTALREYFAASGVTFPKAVPPDQEAKALFFNDRSGALFVRATAGDMEIIEKAVQVLNVTPAQVQLEVKFVEWPGDAKPELTLELQQATVATAGSGAPSLTGLLTAARFPAVLRALEGRPGVNLLAAPRITTLSGRQARVSITAPKPVRDPATGATNSLDFGPVLDVIPVVMADYHSIQLTVLASVSEYLGVDAQSPPVPRMRATSLQGSAVLWDGQTLVLVGDLVAGPVKAGADGRAERAEASDPPAVNGRRRILVFVTPTIIDPAGRRLHHPDNLPFDPNTVPPQPK